jgi:hypothetical protein
VNGQRAARLSGYAAEALSEVVAGWRFRLTRMRPTPACLRRKSPEPRLQSVAILAVPPKSRPLANFKPCDLPFFAMKPVFSGCLQGIRGAMPCHIL